MKTMKQLFNYFGALALILSVGQVQAQGAATVDSTLAFYIIAGFVMVVALIVLAVSVVVLRLLKVIVKQEAVKLAEAKGETYEEEKSWWAQFLTKANDAVPVEREETIMLDHDYDGIRELDNHLPPWWKWLFYLTIVFGVVYMISYHLIGSRPLQDAEYQAEMAAAAEAQMARLASLPEDNIDETNVIFVDNPDAISKGKQVFINNCSQCHKELGEGGIGPNLTDDYWLHGGDIKSIFTSIKKGIPEKGMISWEPLLSPTQMQNVSSYIMTLRGSNPPNAKAPQGTLFVPAEVESLDSAAVQQVLDTINIEGSSIID